MLTTRIGGNICRMEYSAAKQQLGGMTMHVFAE